MKKTKRIKTKKSSLSLKGNYYNMLFKEIQNIITTEPVKILFIVHTLM